MTKWLAFDRRPDVVKLDIAPHEPLRIRLRQNQNRMTVQPAPLEGFPGQDRKGAHASETLWCYQ
jgi:hypothetical protein